MDLIPSHAARLSPAETKSVLKILVTCTMDETREQALDACLKSLVAADQRCAFADGLLIVDNNSKIITPVRNCELKCPKVILSRNIGYWGAVLWALENCETIFGRPFEFTHPIESDLVFFKAERLEHAVTYLQQASRVNTVRTQEFSVRFKSRYFKGRRSLFAKTRSRVAPYNGVTSEPVRLTRSNLDPEIWETNWHAKMPALHRADVLRVCLTKLKAQGEFTELDFMRLMSEGVDKVGLLDGGIYYSLLAVPQKGNLTGSYSSESDLKKLGYRSTRTDRIDNESFTAKLL